MLITGGTGMIGSRLTTFLLQNGYKVRYLTRSPKHVDKNIEAFKWDVKAERLAPEALEGVSFIINLAGANIFSKRWTKSRKQVLLESRTRSTALLRKALHEYAHQVKLVISASAVNYYGENTGAEIKNEADPAGDGFLAAVCKAWEQEADQIAALGIPVIRTRLGVVLSKKEGAFEAFAKPVKYGLAAPLGTGKQYVSWIHIDDLCNIFMFLLEHEGNSDVYNAVAPNPVTNRDLIKAIAEKMNRPMILPAVPALLIKLAVGEVASVVVGGVRVSSEKIEKKGFRFQYPTINEAVKNLLEKE